MTEQEARKVDAEIAKLIAESARINQEAAKISQEARWYPFVATAGLFAAALALLKFLSA